MQKKFGIVVVAAIQESAHKPNKVPRPGVHKSSRHRVTRRHQTSATVAAA